MSSTVYELYIRDKGEARRTADLRLAGDSTAVLAAPLHVHCIKTTCIVEMC